MRRRFPFGLVFIFAFLISVYSLGLFILASYSYYQENLHYQKGFIEKTSKYIFSEFYKDVLSSIDKKGKIKSKVLIKETSKNILKYSNFIKGLFIKEYGGEIIFKDGYTEAVDSINFKIHQHPTTFQKTSAKGYQILYIPIFVGLKDSPKYIVGMLYTYKGIITFNKNIISKFWIFGIFYLVLFIITIISFILISKQIYNLSRIEEYEEEKIVPFEELEEKEKERDEEIPEAIYVE